MASNRAANPGPLVGALLGFTLATPWVAWMFAGHRWLGWPVAPFGVFEAVSSRLPGPVITRSIEAMVAVLRKIGVPDTARAAKLAEKAMAVGGYLVLCAVGAGIGFLLARRVRGRPAGAAAVVAGAVAILPAMLALAPERAWTAMAFAAATGVAWAWGLGWAHARLAGSEAQLPGLAPVAEPTRRKVLIQLGGASAVLTLIGVGLRHPGAPGQAARPVRSPLPPRPGHFEPVPGTRAEVTPVEEHYRIDINLVPPKVDGERWRLQLDGMVESAKSLTLAQLRAYPPLDQFVTLSCISNPVGGDLIGTTRWTGVSLSRVLDDLRPAAGATHLTLYAEDGFDESISIEEVRADPRVMLAYAWDGAPLAPEHGFPLRIYIPDRYGMKQPKWIKRIEVTGASQPGYWVRRGWDAVARVRATSVIDVIGPTAMRGSDGALRLPMGGIAYAGTRGISRVEVRTDGEPWQLAQLRPPISSTTWYLWRYDWPFRDGAHTFEVRCVEADGSAQLESRAPPHPSGATGIHSKEYRGRA